MIDAVPRVEVRNLMSIKCPDSYPERCTSGECCDVWAYFLLWDYPNFVASNGKVPEFGCNKNEKKKLDSVPSQIRFVRVFEACKPTDRLAEKKYYHAYAYTDKSDVA